MIVFEAHVAKLPQDMRQSWISVCFYIIKSIFINTRNMIMAIDPSKKVEAAQTAQAQTQNTTAQTTAPEVNSIHVNPEQLMCGCSMPTYGGLFGFGMPPMMDFANEVPYPTSLYVTPNCSSLATMWANTFNGLMARFKNCNPQMPGMTGIPGMPGMPGMTIPSFAGLTAGANPTASSAPVDPSVAKALAKELVKQQNGTKYTEEEITTFLTKQGEAWTKEHLSMKDQAGSGAGASGGGDNNVDLHDYASKELKDKLKGQNDIDGQVQRFMDWKDQDGKIPAGKIEQLIQLKADSDTIRGVFGLKSDKAKGTNAPLTEKELDEIAKMGGDRTKLETYMKNSTDSDIVKTPEYKQLQKNLSDAKTSGYLTENDVAKINEALSQGKITIQDANEIKEICKKFNSNLKDASSDSTLSNMFFRGNDSKIAERIKYVFNIQLRRYLTEINENGNSEDAKEIKKVMNSYVDYDWDGHTAGRILPRFGDNNSSEAITYVMEPGKSNYWGHKIEFPKGTKFHE